jgi:hypothetical protein
VDQAGLVSIHNRNYYVGKRHHEKIASVMLDPEACAWVILDADGRQLRTHPAAKLDVAIRGQT